MDAQDLDHCTGDSQAAEDQEEKPAQLPGEAMSCVDVDCNNK